MDGSSYSRGSRGRGHLSHDAGSARGRPHSRNKHWTAADGASRSNTPNHSDSERWERGGHRGGGRGRGSSRGAPALFHNVSLRLNHSPSRSPQPHRVPESRQPVQPEIHEDVEIEDVHEDDDGHYEEEENEEAGVGEFPEIHEPELDSPEEREKFYQELVKAREQERKTAIAEGKMDDPMVPKRLEDAISIVGTCMDMCPRFERYRRERENNLFEWETIPGTKRVDHNRAVKMYERAVGDKTIPSDLRPPLVLKRTLNYLFHDLLPRGGFSATFNFIRDRSRAVRNDFTMQHITGPLAIECHDRCARFHILALHFERDRPGFSIPLEEQQLMNTLQSLKEFYKDQRGKYESPTELEMRVYHRLIHIRDQKERPEDIPDHILDHPVFKLTTAFRLHVQAKSAPISKSSKLVVTDEGMQIFAQLAAVLVEQGSTVMVYLVACLLERLFGKDTIDDIEAIKGGLSISDIIDGVSSTQQSQEVHSVEETEEVVEVDEVDEEEFYDEAEEEGEGGYTAESEPVPAPLKTSASEWPSSTLTPEPSNPVPAPASAFAGLVSKPNPFGVQSVFGTSVFAPTSAPPKTVFSSTPSTSTVFGSFAPTAGPAVSTPTPNSQPPAPPQPTPAPSLFSSGMSGFASTPASGSAAPSANLFGTFMPTPAAPQPQLQPTANQTTTPVSIFGGSSGSLFSTPFVPSTAPGIPASTSSTIPSPVPSSSLDPKAPEFTPHTKSSIFQPPSFAPSTNGTHKESIPQSMIPSVASSQPIPAASTSEPKLNGTTLFNTTPSSSPSFFDKPVQPASKSVTPPLNRPMAPPLLKINTNTSSESSSSSVDSPRIPPPLPRMQPVSLPSTPTTVLQPPSALLGHLRNTLQGSGSLGSLASPTGSQEMLSPLVMGSPTTSGPKSFNNFSPLSTPKANKRFRAGSPSPSMASRKGKDPERIYDVEEVEEMKRKALAFAQKGVLVREMFYHWVQRATDRAAYLEARKRDEERVKRLRTGDRTGPLALRAVNANMNGRAVDKRRRISTNGGATDEHGLSPMKKRARKRMPSEYRPPRTDEELAKRFKENHEDNELRWAKGSFLQVIRKKITKLRAAALKLPWNIWLSMNPESDATAIWLERKFDVPASGSWASEIVFSIPLSSAGGPGVAGYPGLIIFEATPMGDVSDELEKKYRILDDCSRLREIIKSLSPRRHFIPSLLIICWDEPDQTFTTSDFFTMVKKLIADSALLSFQVFAITFATKDLDIKLEGSLNTLALDTEGKLARTLSLDGVFKLFEPKFESFLGEWIENCTINGRFNWNLYAQLIQVSIDLLNIITNSAKSLLELSGPQDPLPDFDFDIIDSESCYDAANEWLSTLNSRDESRMVATDMHSHRNIGQAFPGRIFIEHLFEISKTRFERLYPRAANTERAILISSIDASVETFKEAIRPNQLKLSQTYNFSARRSPKRRAYSVTTSELGSPESKRPRLAASVASTDDGDVDGIRTVPTTPQMNGNRQIQTPSPTGTSVSAAATDRPEREGPTVTVAMLRALTRDLKKKYAVGC